jgi:hypothetical protein
MHPTPLYYTRKMVKFDEFTFRVNSQSVNYHAMKLHRGFGRQRSMYSMPIH